MPPKTSELPFNLVEACWFRQAMLAHEEIEKVIAPAYSIGLSNGIAKARWAYEAHYASTPGGVENCVKCGNNFRDPVHLRADETKEDRLKELAEW